MTEVAGAITAFVAHHTRFLAPLLSCVARYSASDTTVRD